MQKRKCLLKKLGLNLCYLVGFLVLIEGLSFILIHCKYGFDTSPETLFDSRFSRFGNGPDPLLACTGWDFLEPHPLMGFIYKRSGPCAHHFVNSNGLWGPEFPEERDKEKFTILVLGSSLAEQSTLRKPGQPADLERALNERFISPNGKPFHVINGAIVAAREPMAVGTLMLYSHLVDAAVTIEGRSEFKVYGSEMSIANAIIRPRAKAPGIEDIVHQYFLREALGLFSYLGKSPIGRHSSFSYLLSSGLLEIFAENMDVAKPHTPENPHPLAGKVASSAEDSGPPLSPLLKERFILEYARHLHALKAIAQESRVKLAIFLQPVPAIGKKLTPKEISVAGDLSYKKNYLEMTDRLLRLRKEGIPIFSLADIFSSTQESIYVDDAHLRNDQEIDGYLIMSRAMADDLAREWRLKRR